VDDRDHRRRQLQQSRQCQPLLARTGAARQADRRKRPAPGLARASYATTERVLAAAIADDLDVEPDSLAPRLAAASAVTGLRELYDSREARLLEPEPTEGGLIRLVNQATTPAPDWQQ
jgi:hypothetical protein